MSLITQKQIAQIFEGFRSIRVMVIGDVMVDAYLYGNVDRISPEAPVPVVSLTRRVNMLGGAGNVAINFKSLGATPLLYSVIGNDLKGSELLDLMQKENLDTSGIISSTERITTTKFRIIGNKNQMLRVDEEMVSDLTPLLENLFLEKIESALNTGQIHVVVFQDYNKGVITKSVINRVIAIADAQNIPVVVDPKRKNFDTYRGARLFKPNLKELREGLKTDFAITDKSALHENIATLQESKQHDMVMVTLGEEGIVVRYKNDDGFLIHSQPTVVRNISDVSGAGDTVISVAALCVALGVDPPVMTFLANLAGGIVCEYVGVVPVDKDRLMREAFALANDFNE